MRARDLLLMGAGAGSGWAHPSAVRALDFKNNRYMRQGVQYALPDLASVTRAGTGWLDSIGGIWSEFLAGVLRRTDRGAAIGGQFTNKIRNPRGEGGTVGIIGSGGVLPTNWNVNNTVAGIAISYLGSGVEDGVPYSDVSYSGTSVGTNFHNRIDFEFSPNATAVAGQAWGVDFGVKLIAGTAISVAPRIISYNATTALGNYNGGSITPNASVQRMVATAVIPDVAVTNVRGALILPITASGVAYDFTIRIYAPKLVQLAVIEGADLITNGDFASGTGWSFTGAGWSIGSGVASAVAATSGDRIYQDITPTAPDLVFKTVFKVSNFMNGYAAVTLSGGSSANGTNRSANGTFTEYLAPPSTMSRISVYARQTPTNLSVDNLSVKQVTAGYMPAFPILPAVGVIADSTKLADDVAAINLDWFTAAGLGAGMAQLAVFELTHGRM